MGRYYKVSKRLLEEDAERILEELRRLEDVEKAEFDGEDGENGVYGGIRISTKSGEYTAVMDYAVNVFAREGGGAELSFRHFV